MSSGQDIRVEGNLRAFLRGTSVRFVALYFVPFYAGMALAGKGTLGYAALGVLYWLVFSFGIEATNRLTDRSEDEVNRPERTQMCAQVGWRTIQRVEIVSWCGVVAFNVLWLYLNSNVLLAVLAVGGVVAGIGYSRGPRLSRARYIGFVLLNLVFAGVFMFGWAAGAPFSRAGGPDWHQLTSFAPVAVIVSSFVVSFAGIKDLTDRRGDLAIGYRSPFVDMLERGQTGWLKAIACIPFAFTLIFTVAGLLPLRFIVLLAFVPVSVVVVETILRAQEPRERMVVREIFYNYWFAFSSAALLLLIPRLDLLLAVGVSFAYWVLATRWLHWVEFVTIAEFKRLMYTVTTRRRPGPAQPA